MEKLEDQKKKDIQKYFETQGHSEKVAQDLVNTLWMLCAPYDEKMKKANKETK